MLTLLLPSECKLSDASAERIAAAIFSGSPLERLGYVSVYTARGMHLCGTHNQVVARCVVAQSSSELPWYAAFRASVWVVTPHPCFAVQVNRGRCFWQRRSSGKGCCID